MIDMTYDYSAEKQSPCECGDPECIGPAEAVQAVVEAFVLDSPILKLVKERNEARELVKKLLSATDLLAVGEDYYAVMLEAHRATIAWKGGAQ
jgi:hypothetical protein